jgi:hypothetical protein
MVNKRYFSVFQPENKDDRPLSKKIRAITGHGAEYYYPPLTDKHHYLVSIISDESEFDDHLCISHIIILGYLSSNEINAYENRLNALIAEYGISSIHFSELFGKKQILVPSRRRRFLVKYAKIVSEIPMFCTSFSTSKSKVLKEVGDIFQKTSDLYIAIRWSNLERITPILLPYSIIHIFTEQENNLTENYGEELRLRLHQWIQGSEVIKNAGHSVCLNPFVFTKRALLFSSLADLVAYGSNKVQTKIEKGIPENKILTQYGDILSLVKAVFTGYGNLTSKELIHLIDVSETLF